MTASARTDASTAHRGLKLPDLGLLLLMQAVWGGSFVFTKLAMFEIPPLLFVALRFLIVSLLLMRFLRWHPGQMHLVAGISFFTGALHFGLMNTGLAMAEDVAPVAIFVQLGVPFATLLSVFVLHERLGIWRISALIVAFSGVLVVGFDPAVFKYANALVFVAIGAFVMAVGTIFMRQVRGVPVYDMQAWIAIFAWPPLLVASLIFEGDPVPPLLSAGLAGWGGLLFVVLGTSLIGHAAYFYIMQRYEVGLTAPFMLLAPILGAAGGALFLGDVITWRMIVGGAMTLIGVLIITMREGRRRPSAKVSDVAL
ncbi:DMT family transporter [Microbaculum marinum]|uniref:EamA family transporter n=1 Tax=Microbaculum marinum TaxID=1764581 RepID=A0AAW9RSF2_9HYPH